MSKVVTLGEILVEIMAEDRGDGFGEPLRLLGPFPSGAPGIFIDQVARLGQPCAIIGCVGDDEFGRVNLERLARDGVDVSAVEVLPGHATGTAFVRYRVDGGRDFVFNIANSACGRIRLTGRGRALLGECGHLHVSGASLFSDAAVEVAATAVRIVKANGGTVSFDPNVRETRLLGPLQSLLAACDVFLPSGPELTLLTNARDPDQAAAEVLALGAGAVVLKRGKDGATYYDADGRVDRDAYRVAEVDPTGAGDCFDATFVTCRLQGYGIGESLEYANAAGAHAVSVRGPMEGTAGFAQLEAVRSRARRAYQTPRAPLLLPNANAVTAVCSAHPLVLEAAMLEAEARGAPVLIEATCNQVNHLGGYSGLTPAAFRDLVHGIAERVSFPRDLILLGGDHLGPTPWRNLPAPEAMQHAEAMVAAYVAAGFEKLHLDTSMGCLGETEAVPEALAAERAARLAAVAERARADGKLRYVIGTEVPTPGGATEEIERVAVTRPEAVLATLDEHRRAFAAAGADSAYAAVVAVVAQPGIEFDNLKVVAYDPELAAELRTALAAAPGLVFEAHSTDYQPPDRLRQLVRDGFAILKVGPALSFALRRALYGLDQIAVALDHTWTDRSLAAEMEHVMLADPTGWESHCRGGQDEQRWLRHFGYSDRIRYYWPHPAARQSVERLLAFLMERRIPESLISEFLPGLQSRIIGGSIDRHPRTLVLESVRDVLRPYAAACDSTLAADAVE